MADVAGEVAGLSVLPLLLVILLKVQDPELAMLTVLVVPELVIFTTPLPFTKFKVPPVLTVIVPNCQPKSTMPLLGACTVAPLFTVKLKILNAVLAAVPLIVWFQKLPQYLNHYPHHCWE